jgi:hypothetical protein
MVASCPNLTCLAEHMFSTYPQESGWFSQSHHLSAGDKCWYFSPEQVDPTGE